MDPKLSSELQNLEGSYKNYEDPSSSQGSTNFVDVDPKLSSELQNLEDSYKRYEYSTSSHGATTKLPLIQRVQFRLRNKQKFAKNYEPMIIAIGPIHHRKEHLSGEFKRGLAHLFINNFIKNETTTAYNAIKRDISQLKKRYKGDVIKDYKDDELALMLFVDGCAVLAFIATSVDEKFRNDFGMKCDVQAFGANDLFLLKNQLPFEVLDSRMNNSDKASDLMGYIKKFIVLCMLNYDDQKYISNYDLPENPNHLLELLRKKFLGQKYRKVRSFPYFRADYIIDFISRKKERILPRFRYITELQAVGIKVKKSGTSYLTDISFEGEGSLKEKLKLPSIVVDDWTAPKFLNLVAYEMCPDFYNDSGVCSYVCFMDSLIDKADDVKELRAAGVLHNSLRSDEDVVKFFNEIRNDLVPNDAAYRDVKSKIQKHYQNKWVTWLAQFYRDHFSIPWTVLASIAALIGLVLTAIQTWNDLKSKC